MIPVPKSFKLKLPNEFYVADALTKYSIAARILALKESDEKKA